ncbi:sensor histidine kinase [Nocardioides dubius]|uniref:Sensor histidine kinase n=1 Tax=Nocardioides dubius TaxID=317019 RepID=A0ABP4EBM8_9ACTN
MTDRQRDSRASGCHDAVLYADDDLLIEAAAQHLRAGAERGQTLMLACAPQRNRAIRDAVPELPRIAMLGESDAYLSCGETLEFYAEQVRQAGDDGGAGLCVVGALPDRTYDVPRSWPRWSRYEAAVNHVFADQPFDALCTYDTRRADPKLLRAVRQTHAHLYRDGATRVNPEYRDPAELLREWSAPPVLAAESERPVLEIRGIADQPAAERAGQHLADVLSSMDTALQSYAGLLFPADPALIEVDEYVLAVDAVLANAVRHGTDPVALRMWVDHDHVITTVTDSGAGFDDPFRGFTTASASGVAHQHEGLWLARQFTDDLSFRHDPDGFTVRLRADLDVRSEALV